MWTIPLTVLIIMLSLLYAQMKHYEFLEKLVKAQCEEVLNQDMEVRFKEFDDYKKRVDSLTIKAGFKL